MADVDGNTLIVAIQAVEAQMEEMGRVLATHALPEGEEGDLEDLMLCYSNAAEALRRAYEEALAEAGPGSNLPPYEKLVGGVG